MSFPLCLTFLNCDLLAVSETGSFWLNNAVMAGDPTWALGMDDYGQYSYDATVATMLACDALYKAGSAINGSSVMATIQKPQNKFLGVSGLITFDSNGDKPVASALVAFLRS